MNILDREESQSDLTDSLESHIDRAREEAIKERADEDLTDIDLWISEEGFVSPFPDRVVKKDINSINTLLTELASIIDEPVAGTVFVMNEDLGELLWQLSQNLQLTLGYIPNPDVEYVNWKALTRDLRSIHPLDIDGYFKPIHLPKRKEFQEEQPADVEGEEDGH